MEQPSSLINIEVAYATAQQQWLLSLQLESGSTAADAVTMAVKSGQLPQGLSLDDLAVGVWSKVLKSPQTYRLQAGDRVELYRPLTLDPMEIRKARAAKARAARGKSPT